MTTGDLFRPALPLVAVLALTACGGASTATNTTSTNPVPAAATAPQNAGPLPAEEHLETAKAVMVTVELDYGPAGATIAQAIRDVERRSEATGAPGARTFAVLDAYGERSPDGKLHMSMHVSAELMLVELRPISSRKSASIRRAMPANLGFLS